ncbi:hypothetical protein QW131_05560 [Roseibium salinum]|nr:hypothetical protein [Roseibium salinum]
MSQKNRGDEGLSDMVSVLSEGRIVGVELGLDTEITFLDEDIQEKGRQGAIRRRQRHFRWRQNRFAESGGRGGGPGKLRSPMWCRPPIWKTAYRVVMLPQDKARLQAWAVLEKRQRRGLGQCRHHPVFRRAGHAETAAA